MLTFRQINLKGHENKTDSLFLLIYFIGCKLR